MRRYAAPACCSTPAARAGFSLIELLVASVAASVLAVTAGTMLVYAWMSWRDVQEGIEMQRDAALALTFVRNQVWEAYRGDVAVLNGSLRIRTEDGWASIGQQGADLVFDPDLAEDGDERILLHDRLEPGSFQPAVISRLGRTRVDVAFELLGDIGHESTAFRTAAAPRN